MCVCVCKTYKFNRNKKFTINAKSCLILDDSWTCWVPSLTIIHNDIDALFRKEWRILNSISYLSPLYQGFEWLKIYIQRECQPCKIIRLQIGLWMALLFKWEYLRCTVLIKHTHTHLLGDLWTCWAILTVVHYDTDASI